MEVQRITITLPQDRSYDIRVGNRILMNLGTHLAALGLSTRLFVIADQQVLDLHRSLLEQGLEGCDYALITIQGGEASKSLDQAQRIWQWLMEQGCDRHCTVVAFGGGVTCDLAGFVASTWMRGIPCVQVPTSLLAMVDASVGGKTALDLEGARNVVGTFHQPSYVAMDLGLLGTLDRMQVCSGLAEMAKMALLSGNEACLELVEAAPKLLAGDEEALQHQILAAVRFKAGIVEQDETDQGVRACLNYGHTLGHALEAVLGPQALTHGQAVAEGMRFAARLSQNMFGADPAFSRAQDSLLDSLGLEPLDLEMDPAALLAAMSHDKKSRKGRTRFVLLTEPGTWELVDVPRDVLEKELDAWG